MIYIPNTSRGIMIFSFLFILVEFIINPIGEFPLGDDWAYSKRVLNFLDNGSLESPNWGGASFLTQLLWGYFFCKIFGFSFTVLRFSQLLSVFFASLIFYHIILRITSSNRSALITTLFLFLNPIFLYQSNTFQPDIPYTLLVTLSFYFFLEYIARRGFKDYIFGLLFAFLATFLKQTGISIGLAFTLSFLFFKQITVRSVFVGLFPVILLISSVLLLMTNNLIVGVDNNQIQIFFKAILNPEFDTLQRFGFYSINSSLTLGLFLSPISIPVSIAIYRLLNSRRHIKILSSVFVLYIVLILFKTYFRSNSGLQGGGIEYLPFSGNSIYDLGMGPIVMTGILQNEIPALPKLGEIIWFFISLIGAVGFISFLYLCILMIKEHLNFNRDKVDYSVIAGFFSIFISIVYLAPILLVYANTKYLTAVIPFFLITTISSIEFLRKKYDVPDLTNYNVAILLGLPLILFGVLATHDYISFNRTRWDALNHLTDTEKIPVEKIDGGFEFNEWHLSHLYTWKMTNDPNKKGRFWPVVDDEYIVTVKRIEGYDVYKEINYKKWLTPGNYNIKILKRKTG